MFYENYKGNTTLLSWGELHYNPSQNITQHIIDNDEDLEQIHPEDLLISVHELFLLHYQDATFLLKYEMSYNIEGEFSYVLVFPLFQFLCFPR